jgi:hypothetical protein
MIILYKFDIQAHIVESAPIPALQKKAPGITINVRLDDFDVRNY